MRKRASAKGLKEPLIKTGDAGGYRESAAQEQGEKKKKKSSREVYHLERKHKQYIRKGNLRK